MTEPVAAGRTRWARTFVAAVGALAAVVGISFGLNSGVLAAQFVPGGVPVQLSIAEADVHGLGGAADSMTLADGSRVPVVALNGESAEVSGLCATMAVHPPIGPSFVLVARAPAKRTGNLSIATNSFTGNAHAENIVIGRDASALTRSALEGPAGGAGLQADEFVLSHADAEVIGVSADTFELDSLTVALGEAGTTC